jgi:hypothetical protein
MIPCHHPSASPGSGEVKTRLTRPSIGVHRKIVVVKQKNKTEDISEMYINVTSQWLVHIGSECMIYKAIQIDLSVHRNSHQPGI